MANTPEFPRRFDMDREHACPHGKYSGCAICNVPVAIDPPALLPAIVKAIAQEREFQDKKWGTVFDNPHSVGAWLLIAEFELNEAKVAAIKGGKGRDSVVAEIVQTIATLVACLEQHGLDDKPRSV